jgi:adenosylcobinamide amidohydrolase
VSRAGHLRPVVVEPVGVAPDPVLLVVALGDGWRGLSSAPLGGGLGPCRWVLIAQVATSYDRVDPDRHLTDLAGGRGLDGPGVGMLTAADVSTAERADDRGAEVVATVGLALPTLAAAAPAAGSGLRVGTIEPGTINIVGLVPCPLADAALVNLVVTVTEAKVQALHEAGVAATGTASDAVCLLCRDEPGDPADEAVAFGGPRSVWGSRLARAARSAVLAGTRRWADGAGAR